MRCHSSGRARATACLRPSPSVSAWLRTRWFKKIAAVRGNSTGAWSLLFWACCTTLLHIAPAAGCLVDLSARSGRATSGTRQCTTRARPRH